LPRLFDKDLSFEKAPSEPLVSGRVPRFVKQESEIDAMLMPHLPYRLAHDLTGDAPPRQSNRVATPPTPAISTGRSSNTALRKYIPAWPMTSL
jgi:hypothetical protein